MYCLIRQRLWSQRCFTAVVVPKFAPCQIMHPLVLVGLGVGVGEGLGLGVGLGLGNQVATSTRGCRIWQGWRIRHNTVTGESCISPALKAPPAGRKWIRIYMSIWSVRLWETLQPIKIKVHFYIKALCLKYYYYLVECMWYCYYCWKN